MGSNAWKAISLFAGAGGCSLGFHMAGIDMISAYDNSDSAVETYNKNLGKGKCKNVDLSICDFKVIRNKLGLKRGELDLIIGGPPCQGFTTAGNRFWDDPRNKLIQNYAQALEIFYPRWFMMENVEGILTTAKGIYVVESIKKMIELGYSVYMRKVYIQEYGIPQRRKRVFIIGNREGKKFEYPKAVALATGSIYRNSSTTLKDAIGDLEGFENPDIDHTFKHIDGIQLQRIKALKVGQSMKDLPKELQHKSFNRRASRRVCDGTPSEKRGGAPVGMKRLSYDEPCLTITSAATSEFIHPVENRPLTMRECARVQTFPDDFLFCGSETQKILQIGNAIPPKFAEKMALQIIKCDANPKHSAPNALVEYNVTKAGAKSPALDNTCKMLDTLKIQKDKQLSPEVLLCH